MKLELGMCPEKEFREIHIYCFDVAILMWKHLIQTGKDTDFQLKEMYKVYTLTFQASSLTVDQPVVFAFSFSPGSPTSCPALSILVLWWIRDVVT